MSPALKVQPARKASPGQRVIRERKVQAEHRVPKGQRATRERKDRPVHKVSLEQLARPVRRATLGPKATLAPRDRRLHLDCAL